MTTPIDIVIDSTGITAPDYDAVLAYLQQQYLGIFGSDIDLDNSTPDAQLLAVFSQIIYDYGQSTVAVFNAFSPAFAQGAGLSSVVKINGLQRESSTFSTVTLTLTGNPTTITNGIVGDDQGLNTSWALPAIVTIPIGGSINVGAICTSPGAIAAAPSTLNVILTPTLGWQTANNSASATLGQPVETDATLRQRQSVSTSLPAQSPLDAIAAAIANVPGVTNSIVYENDTGSADGDGRPAHSITAVVAGSSAIATTIAAKKAPGVTTYGTTSVVVYDSQGVPNTINFYILSVVLVSVTVNIHPLGNFATTTKTKIEQAVAGFISSLGIGAYSIFLVSLVQPLSMAMLLWRRRG